MPTIDFHLKGDKCWPDLDRALAEEGKVVHLGNDAPAIGVALLDKGMASGKPSVTIRLDLPDGRIVLAETSARLFCTVAKVILGKYPDLFEGDDIQVMR